MFGRAGVWLHKLERNLISGVCIHIIIFTVTLTILQLLLLLTINPN